MSIELYARPLVYVAGPFTHPDPVINTRNACTIGSLIVDTGLASALVPHTTLLWHLVDPRPVDYWYALDLAHVARCDALYRMTGPSTGADREVEFAHERNLPVFNANEDANAWEALRRWLQGKQ